MVARFFLLLTLLLTACAPDPLVIEKKQGFAPRPDQTTIYVIPFRTVMVPPAVSDNLFDTFVDSLNQRGENLTEEGYAFVILKKNPADIDPAWLAEHHVLAGDIFGYLEDSGCCSTAIELKARLEYRQPTIPEPTLTLNYPTEIYFDHDRASLAEKRRELAQTVAEKMATGVWETILN